MFQGPMPDLGALGPLDPGALPDLSDLGSVDLGPALLGGGAALAVQLAAPLATGALIATYAPRQPGKGALMAVALGVGAAVLSAGLLSAGAAASAATAQR